MRVGIIGTGGMGNVHARHYRRVPNVELIAFDVNAELLTKFCSTHEAAPAASAEDLISKADLVDVCLPTDAHAEFALRAIAAGRAVLIEKPLARTLAEAESIAAAGLKGSVPVAVGQVVRYFADYRVLHNAVLSGRVGTPAAVRMRRGGGAPKGSGLWFQDFARSGGVLLDLAVHDFDWLRWTIGDVESVTSRSVRARHPDSTAFVGDYALTTIAFQNGCLAHVESTWMDPSGFRVSVEVAGSAGLLEFDSRQTATIRTHTEGTSRAEAPMASSDDPYFLMLSELVRALETGQPVPISVTDGIKAMSVALAAIESAQTGRPAAPVY